MTTGMEKYSRVVRLIYPAVSFPLKKNIGLKKRRQFWTELERFKHGPKKQGSVSSFSCRKKKKKLPEDRAINMNITTAEEAGKEGESFEERCIEIQDRFLPRLEVWVRSFESTTFDTMQFDSAFRLLDVKSDGALCYSVRSKVLVKGQLAM